MKEGEVMKGMTSAEVIEKVTREKTIAEIYIMALETKQSGKSFDEFIEELRVKLDK